MFDLYQLHLVVFLLLKLQQWLLFEGNFLFVLFFYVWFFIVHFIQFSLKVFVLSFKLSDFKFQGFIFAHQSHILPVKISRGLVSILLFARVLIIVLILISPLFELLLMLPFWILSCIRQSSGLMVICFSDFGRGIFVLIRAHFPSLYLLKLIKYSCLGLYW